MVIIFIKIVVRPEKRKELLQTLHSIVEQLSNESGCLHVGLYQDVGDENDLLVVEEWASRKDSNNYLGSNLFTVLLGAESLMVRPPNIVIHAVNHSKEWEA